MPGTGYRYQGTVSVSGYLAASGNYPETNFSVGLIFSNKYKITFNANGGTNASGGNFAVSGHDVSYGDGTTTSYVTATYGSTNFYSMGGNNPTRAGYNASGASIKGTSYWNSSGQWCYTNDLTVYAHWEPSARMLTINPNGGAYNGSVANAEISANIGTTYTIPNPIRPGYFFHGWTWTDGGSGFGFQCPSIGYPIGQANQGGYSVAIDENGAKYTWTITNPSSSCWNYITLATYAVNAGETVTISGQIRTIANTAGIGGGMYHGAYANDYANNKYGFGNLNGWEDFSFSRTFTSACTAWF